MGGEAGEGIRSWWLLWAVEKKNPGPWPFLSWAYYSGTSSGKLYLLLVMTEHILIHVHDTKAPVYLFLWPLGFWDSLEYGEQN